jgi:hypothetical protein
MRAVSFGIEENAEAGSGIRLSVAFIGDAGGRNGESGRTGSLFDSGESGIGGICRLPKNRWLVTAKERTPQRGVPTGPGDRSRGCRLFFGR